MSEYTSLEVSKRLAESGFEERAEYGYWRLGAVDVIGGKIRSSANWGPRDTRLVCRAYRSDTLLAWLIARGWDISVGKPHDKVLVDAASMKLNKRIPTDAPTLPDALAEVVMKVMEVSK